MTLSELARQVASFGPAKMLLMGRGENSIYEIDQEIGQDYPDVRRHLVISSISDPMAVEVLFRDERPEIVLHAAAHKHVHLMEAYPDEAVKNNIMGTRILIDAAVRYGFPRSIPWVSTKHSVDRWMSPMIRLAERWILRRTSAILARSQNQRAHWNQDRSAKMSL